MIVLILDPYLYAYIYEPCLEYSQNSTVDWSNLLHYVANIPEIDLKSIEEAPYDSSHWSEMID